MQDNSTLIVNVDNSQDVQSADTGFDHSQCSRCLGALCMLPFRFVKLLPVLIVLIGSESTLSWVRHIA